MKGADLRTETTYDTFVDNILKSIGEKTKGESETDKHKCNICNDKCIVYVKSEDGDIVSRRCSCYARRQTERIGRESGFGVLLELYSFDNFVTREGFQQKMLEKAKEFCDDEKAHFFFFGGQSGCGKTHLCTAIAKHFITKGFSTRYICWNEFADKIKKSFSKPDVYYQLLDDVKNARVLFIDDLFKGTTARETQPTEADIKLAFEVLNRRYLDGDKITIISAEWTMQDLLKFDQGTFSRVYQGCGPYQVDISRDTKRNYRFNFVGK